jgi:hypothetical protein
MKKIATLLIIAFAIVVVVLLFLTPKGPDLSRFESLTMPRIVTMDNQKMLVVEAKGDPDVAGKRAFGLLLRTYYKIKETPKGPTAPAPRARWPLPFSTPETEWVGLYGMPVPESVTQAPKFKTEPGLTVGLAMWEYGEVAEILHVGAYDKEEPAVGKLMEYVKQQGYEVLGPHEEEYLKGPGLFLKGNPEKYYTIIRYRVRKAEAAQPADKTL